MARPKKQATAETPTATDQATRAKAIGPKYSYLGEDHKGGDVVMVFERTSDQQVFTVTESALKDNKGKRVPDHIRDRLVQ